MQVHLLLLTTALNIVFDTKVKVLHNIKVYIFFSFFKVAEKALTYFEKAVELAPDEARWRLLVAACLRRTGQFHKALTEYQDIHNKFPDNIECLKFLIRLCSDLGLKEAQTYAAELKKAEKAKELKDRQSSARPGTTGMF